MHRYLVRLANRKNYSPKQTLPLMIEFRKKVDSLGAVVKNMRVTEVAIEFDLYAVNKETMGKAVGSLSREYGNVLLDRDLTAEETSFPTLYKDKVETVKESVDLFNEQRYWECHEAMEQIWRREPNPTEKAVQQGMILAASALVHAQKDEDAICLGMIPRTLTKLSLWKEDKYYALNVAMLKQDMEGILQSGKISYPKI
ncbi:MAG TPA: DUF309 domain-containing protein [Nitrososphaerales archaeon]|nr:DUF309 domain-containing protein [Nitrososphaerales archaeon]